MAHIEVEQLLDILEGRITKDAVTSARAHLAECTTCAKEFSEYGAMLDALTHPSLESAPEAAILKALEVFKAPNKKTASLAEIIGTLVFDSFQTASVGLRGDSASRQLSLSADEFNLHLGIDYQTPAIRGQLLVRNETDFTGEFDVLLIDNENGELEAGVANEFGEFFFLKNAEHGASVVIHLPDGRTVRFQLPQTTQK